MEGEKMRVIGVNPGVEATGLAGLVHSPGRPGIACRLFASVTPEGGEKGSPEWLVKLAFQVRQVVEQFQADVVVIGRGSPWTGRLVLKAVGAIAAFIADSEFQIKAVFYSPHGLRHELSPCMADHPARELEAAALALDWIAENEPERAGRAKRAGQDRRRGMGKLVPPRPRVFTMTPRPFVVRPKCEKCGHDSVHMSFNRAVLPNGELEESLICTCERCNYAWRMECRDAREGQTCTEPRD